MFLASAWLEIYTDFQTSHFADFEQFKVYIYLANFGQFEIDPIRFFMDFGQVTVILLSSGKTCLEDDLNTLHLMKIQDLLR